jgi:hypothetical protein
MIKLKQILFEIRVTGKNYVRRINLEEFLNSDLPNYIKLESLFDNYNSYGGMFLTHYKNNNYYSSVKGEDMCNSNNEHQFPEVEEVVDFFKKFQKINEIKIIKPSTSIKIDDKIINPGTSKPTLPPNKIETYSWEDGKKLLSTITRRNAERLFNEILGITPQWIKIETSPLTIDRDFNSDDDNAKLPPRRSFYIYGEYNGEPILIARRETENHSAGQTKLYSKYRTIQLSKALGYYDKQWYDDMKNSAGVEYPDYKYTRKWSRNNKQKYWKNFPKEKILNILKINV